MTGAVPSVFAMLMQMSFEKLAKAALLRSGAANTDWVQRSHGAASRMIAVMRRQRGTLDPLGGPWPWALVLDAIDQLERAHRQLERAGPHLEYPWASTDGYVRWPEARLAIARRLSESTLGSQVLRFAVFLETRFDAIFP